MIIRTPRKTAVRHKFPFLLRYTFEDSQFNSDIFKDIINFIYSSYVRKFIKEREGSDSAINFLLNSFEKSGANVVATDDEFNNVVAQIKSTKEISFEFTNINISLRLKRFGNCVGVRVMDKNGNVHKDMTELLDEICASDKVNRCISPFIERRRIEMPNLQLSRNIFDLKKEVESLKKYIPDVKWCPVDEDKAVQLVVDYLENDQSLSDGVEVGYYYNIPIYLHLLFGDEDKDSTWRLGAIKREATTLTFSAANFGGKLSLQYSVKIFKNEYSEFKGYINYDIEQECQEDLIDVLFKAISSRYLACDIERNPDKVQWKVV